jgi:hypothetical protein
VGGRIARFRSLQCLSGLAGKNSHIGIAEEKHSEMRIMYIFNTQQTWGNKKLRTFSKIQYNCVIRGKNSNIRPRPNFRTEFFAFLHLKDIQLL